MQVSRTTRDHRRAALVVAASLSILVMVFTVLAHCQWWRNLNYDSNLPLAVMLPGSWYNDDAYITFRYSRHLAEGRGFVWNTVDGERLEGSTTLAWVILNALAIKLGADPLVFSQLLGYLAGVAGLLMVYWAGRRFAGLSPGWALVAPALLAAQRQWIVWSNCAMETRVATIAVLAATLAMIREQERSRSGWLVSGLLFFIATLFRPEAPLLHLAAGAGLFLAKRNGPALRAIVCSGLVHGAGLALLCGFRLLYFGQPLPNTSYAKVFPLQVSSGLAYLWKFAQHSHAWLWVPLVIGGAILAWRQKSLIFAAFIGQGVIWTIWVVLLGGGRWEFRFFDFLLPGLAVLIALALASLATSGLFGQRQRLRLWAIGAIATLVILLQASTSFSYFHYPFVYSANDLHQYAIRMQWEGRVLSRYLTAEDRICIGWAGALPYFTGAWHFDPFGLNDAEIARRPPDLEMPIFHQRYAQWQDVVDRRVMFCDLYNKFLFNQPYPEPGSLEEAAVAPWAEEGILVFCLWLPEGGYWIFASPHPREEVEAWATGKGLGVVYATPLPAGAPDLFTYMGDE